LNAPADNETVLEARHVSVTYGAEKVLDDVSFTLKRGELATVLGPNGSGKTTLFRALLGLVPFAGSVHWRPGIKVGYVPQRFLIGRSMPVTVTEFFLLKSDRFWRPRRKFLAHLTHELDLVGLDVGVLARPLGRLSTGQLQRLLVAWAMIDHPDVLLFDEPAAAIDIGFSETIYQVMHRLTEERGTAILLISHDLHVVVRYAANVLCLNRRLLCQGPPAAVLTQEELKRLFGEVSVYPHGHDVHHD
jgi:zinc transport system ATP-binding protein